MNLENVEPRTPGGASPEIVEKFELRFNISLPEQLKQIIFFGDGAFFPTGFITANIENEEEILDVSQIYGLSGEGRTLEQLMHRYREGDFTSWNWPEDLIHIWDMGRYIIAIGHKGEKRDKIYAVDSQECEIGFKPIEIAKDLNSLIESMRSIEELDPDFDEE